jgi:hypothetical protein
MSAKIAIFFFGVLAAVGLVFLSALAIVSFSRQEQSDEEKEGSA